MHLERAAAAAAEVGTGLLGLLGGAELEAAERGARVEQREAGQPQRQGRAHAAQGLQCTAHTTQATHHSGFEKKRPRV